MTSLFSWRKSPDKLVKQAEAELQGILESEEKSDKRKEAQEKLSVTLEAMIALLYGKDEEAKEADPKTTHSLIELLFEKGAMLKLLTEIMALDFEGKKMLARIFEYALTHCKDVAVPYIRSHFDLLVNFVKGYRHSDAAVALSSDTMFRACLRDETLCDDILKSTSPDLVQPFFEYLEQPDFEVHSHALSTLKLILTDHKEVGAGFIKRNYNKFFDNYNKLLMSKNYVTKCEAFKLLGELLVIRQNFDTMIRYVNDPDNLKIAMIALRSQGVTITLQLDVFHVLKLFVANPEKSEGVSSILTSNKRGLMDFVTKFMADTDDDRLVRDKQEVLTQLGKLPDLSNTPASPTAKLQQQQQQQASNNAAPKTESKTVVAATATAKPTENRDKSDSVVVQRALSSGDVLDLHIHSDSSPVTSQTAKSATTGKS